MAAEVAEGFKHVVLYAKGLLGQQALGLGDVVEDGQWILQNDKICFRRKDRAAAKGALLQSEAVSEMGGTAPSKQVAEVLRGFTG